MNKLGRIDIFLEVAQSSSFAKAARKLGISGPAASKQVIALEEELGVKLLNRTTRHVSLTDEGAAYYEHARLALDELNEAATLVQDMKAKPQGLLRVNAPLSFGQMHLLPIISGFAQKYPDVRMEVSLDDRLVDVIGDNYDVVIRIAAMADSSLICKHLSHCPIMIVASPDYLRQQGHPQTPEELRQHRLIGYTLLRGTDDWRFVDKDGKNHTVRADHVFRANSAEMMVQAAIDSIGIAALPVFSVDMPLRTGQLVRLLPDFKIDPARNIYALMPPNRFRTTKVQLFIDWLTKACRAMPWETQE